MSPTSAPGHGSLGLQEANELLAALASRVAAEAGLRALVIKGLSLGAHGLRTDRVSADVDVLLDGHQDAADLAQALASHGWTPRPSTFFSERTTIHSVTLRHDRWPNDLDVHGEFPGLPEAAFEVLWSYRQPVTIAGQRCWMPDRWSSVVIWALHSLRSSSEQERHGRELATVVEAVLPGLSRYERDVLAGRIVGLGATAALLTTPGFAELLAERNVPVAANPDWERRLDQASQLTPWVQVLKESPARERPLVLWKALWPSVHDLRVMDPQLVDTPLGRLAARGRRFVKLGRRALRRAASS